jgi:hypothetical protein
MKRILYITNSTDENNTLGYRHFNINSYLINSFNIDLIDFAFTKQKKTVFLKLINKIFIFPDLYRLKLHSFKKIIFNKLKSVQYDLIIICVLPHSFLELATYVKQLHLKIPVLVDMTDPLSINVSFITYLLPYRYYTKNYETKHLKNVDKLVVLNDEIKKYYEKNYSFLKKVYVLEQGTNPNELSHFVHPQIKKRELKLIYAGMFYQKIREPFELYKSILSFEKAIHLSIYGTFKKKFIPPNNNRFYYGGLIDKSLLITKVNDSDVVVFLDNFYGLQIPGKIIELLATNKPILFIYVNESSPTLKYVRGFKGIFFSKNESSEIINAIKLIEETPSLTYERDVSNYYWENLVKNYSHSLNHFLTKDN